jgi:hypothetical protein
MTMQLNASAWLTMHVCSAMLTSDFMIAATASFPCRFQPRNQNKHFVQEKAPASSLQFKRLVSHGHH